jgi:CMP-N,N'-diacetyllegionaminic acid synthase
VNYSPDVLALIPARSGSKSLPHKNIRPFAGKPLLAHSILQAKACPAVDRVIVSTDSEEYAAIARDYGAEVPFLRPADISGDAATDLQVFQHALGWLAERERAVPGYCVHLRPTHPNRKVSDLASAIAALRARSRVGFVALHRRRA